MIGVALNQRQFTEQDANGAALVKRQFNSISPENVMKWESIHPRPGPDGYDFAAADRYVEFGEKNGMFIVGHTLIWHSQTPRWVFQGEGAERNHARGAARADARSHPHGRGPLQRADQGLGRSQRSAERRRLAATIAVVSDHRRRLHRESFRVCARGRSGRGIALQRFLHRE